MRGPDAKSSRCGNMTSSVTSWPKLRPVPLAHSSDALATRPRNFRSIAGEEGVAGKNLEQIGLEGRQLHMHEPLSQSSLLCMDCLVGSFVCLGGVREEEKCRRRDGGRGGKMRDITP